MKHGRSNNPEDEFPYWILPDKPIAGWVKVDNCSVGSWDQHKTTNQTQSIKKYLTNALETDSWLETNHRFFFKKQEDYENMLLMFSIGWTGQ